MKTTENLTDLDFSSLNLGTNVQKALADAGYETPTPIQALTIPPLLKGVDLVGQAQTGTGKTAAFALPLLSKIDTSKKNVQVLVLTPTRELAKQVAAGFEKYAKYIKNMTILAVYGGQDYDIQLRTLRRGAQVVIGTPGRVMDHIRRGTLVLGNLSALVLDEADEMLRMGFIDDVEWILDQTPDDRQTALFSATMPTPIRRIAQKHLNNPEEIIIETRLVAAEAIEQSYIVIPGAHKIQALIRLLEMEDTDGVMVFVKTKTATVDVAEKLIAHGYAACALNGDLSQSLRERTVERLKNGQLNIVVATDVAARGLDVERISHVFNFDHPNDAETYVHRIGRTGRAGRSGKAILFLTPRDNRILRNIGNATKQNITAITMPSVKAINKKRMEKFYEKITETLENQNIDFFKNLIFEYSAAYSKDQIDTAAAALHIMQGKKSILLKPEKEQPSKGVKSLFKDDMRNGRRKPSHRTPVKSSDPLHGMERFRLEVGDVHGVKPSNIVGAIANEAGIDSEYIGRISIYNDYSTVDLPLGMPRKVWRMLKKVWVCQTQLNISKEPNKSTLATEQRSNQKSVGKNSRKPKKQKFSENSKKRKKTQKLI